MTRVSGKHRRTLESIFASPTLGNINWDDVEALFRHLGGGISKGGGSRVRVLLNGEIGLFHRPHPQKETDRGAVKSVQRFLENAGVQP